MACVLWLGSGRTPGGPEVYQAQDLAAALRALEGLVFDVVVVPAGWPVADQVAVCGALRADSVHARTRVQVA